MVFRCTFAPREDLSVSFKVFLTAWAFVENILFSGLRAGWPSLVYILKQEGIYQNLCSNGTEGIIISATAALQANYSAVSNSSNNNNNISVVMAVPSSQVQDPEEVTLVASCAAQDEVFNQCFTVATASMALSALLYGHLNYKMGIRAPRVLSVLVFCVGSTCIAFITKDTPWLIFPGFLLLSSGGMALYLTNNQISYMYSSGSAAVVGLLCGALEASSFVQTVIKLAYEGGFSLRLCYIALAALYLLTMVSTFCFLPKDFVSNVKQISLASSLESVHDSPLACRSASIIIPPPTTTTTTTISTKTTTTTPTHVSEEALALTSLKEKDDTFQNALVGGENNDCLRYNPKDGVEDTECSNSDKQCRLANHNYSKCPAEWDTPLENPAEDSAHRSRGTVCHFVLTWTFILYLFWASVVQIVLAMCLGTFNPWLEYVMGHRRSEVSRYTDVLYFSMLGTPVLAMLVGIGMDILKKVDSHDQKTIEKRILLTSALSLGVTSVLGIVMCSLIMATQKDLVVLTCVFLVIFRTALYSCGTAFLRIMYPTHMFGILCGIMSVLAGTSSFVQYPLFLWVQHSTAGYAKVFGFLGVLGALSLVHPCFLYYKSRSIHGEKAKKAELLKALSC